MKQTLSKAVVTIIIACTALYAWNHKQPVLTNVQLQNLEAIAAGEEGACIRWNENKRVTIVSQRNMTMNHIMSAMVRVDKQE